jgi:hypothetical protein
MVRPSDDVLIPVVEKIGAATALAVSMGNGNGAITTVVAMRAATRARADRETKVFNT